MSEIAEKVVGTPEYAEKLKLDSVSRQNINYWRSKGIFTKIEDEYMQYKDVLRNTTNNIVNKESAKLD